MNFKCLLIIIFLYVQVPPCVFGQTPATWYNAEHIPWPSALSGGLLAPQFSTFDLDQDDQNELIIFDRFSGIIQVWTSRDNGGSFQLNRDAHVEWPVVNSWMLVRDFNRDHIPDLFTRGMFGIAVYKGILTGEGISFVQLKGDSFIEDSLIFRNKSGGTTNIYHAASDIPVIEDIDGDGDLDIMTFELSGSYLYYYENDWNRTGRELDFSLEHTCWGYFVESQIADGIRLTNNQPECPLPFSLRHSGSASSLIDINLDSLPDLLLGDIGSKYLKVLINSGSSDTGIIGDVSPAFPNAASPASLRYFPAAYKIDLNNDEINDIVVAANEYPLTDHEGVFAYMGTNDPENPFVLRSHHWLQGQYLDFGQYSSPFFIKVSGDELPDILVGYQVTADSTLPQSKIAYFEALSEGEYQLKTLDFGSLSESFENEYKPYLTSGDVDGDGDHDLLAGMSSGNCYLIYNGSGDMNRFEMEGMELNRAGLKMLSGATPELYDIDGDGDLDVTAGNDNGTIGVYINTGSPSQAVFDPDLSHPPNTPVLGQIRTVGENALLGRSAPRIFRNGSDTILVSGSHSGKVYAYRINSGDLRSEFDEVSIDGWPEWAGSNCRLTIGENQIRNSRLLIGNIAGGLTGHLISLIPTNRRFELDPEITIFPNPLSPGQKLQLVTRSPHRIKKIIIYYPNGKLFQAREYIQKPISTGNWMTGIYFIQIIMVDNSATVRKVVVQ